MLSCGRPLMAMMLRAGTPSVPSSAMGRFTSSPAVASSIVGAERNARGSDGVGFALGADQGVSITPRKKMAPRGRLGRIAIRTRIAMRARGPGDKVGKRLDGV